MASYLGGLGTSTYGSSVGPGLSSVGGAIQGFLQNQRFWAQIEEQRRAREEARRHQEEQQKKAEGEASAGKTQGALGGAGVGAGIGLLVGGPVGAVIGGGFGGLSGYQSGSLPGGLAAGTVSGLGAGLGSGLGVGASGAGAASASVPLTAAETAALEVGAGAAGGAAGRAAVPGAITAPPAVQANATGLTTAQPPVGTLGPGTLPALGGVPTLTPSAPTEAAGLVSPTGPTGGPGQGALRPLGQVGTTLGGSPTPPAGKFLGGTANQWRGAAAGALMPGAVVSQSLWAGSPQGQLAQQRFGLQRDRDAWNRQMDVTREGRYAQQAQDYAGYRADDLALRQGRAGRDVTRFDREGEAYEYGKSTRLTPEQIAADRARGIRQEDASIASTEELTRKRQGEAFMTGPIGRGGTWLAKQFENAGTRLGELAEQGIKAGRPTTALGTFDGFVDRADLTPEQARQAAAMKVPTTQPATPAKPLDPTKAAKFALDAASQLAPPENPNFPGVPGAISGQEFNNLLREGAGLETRPSPEAELEARLRNAGDQGSSKEYAEGIVWAMFNEGRISETVRDDFLRRVNQGNAGG